jgi:hypothetical protein
MRQMIRNTLVLSVIALSAVSLAADAYFVREWITRLSGQPIASLTDVEVRGIIADAEQHAGSMCGEHRYQIHVFPATPGAQAVHYWCVAPGRRPRQVRV